MGYLVFSSRIASYLVDKTKLPRHMEEVLAYSIEVLSLNILNVGTSIIIGYIFGVLPQTIICLVSVSAIRIFAGGAHSNSPWRCAIITALVFPAMGIIATQLAPVGQAFTDVILGTSFVVSFLTLCFLSPVESPSAPIISLARRANLKRLSIASFAIILLISAYLRFYVTESIEIQISIALSVLWASFILTSVGHNLFKLIDQSKKNTRKGGNK